MTGISRAVHRLRHRDGGAVAVEAALVLPILALLVFGILEFGMLFRAHLTFSQAARAGARTAVALPRVVGYQDSAQQAVSATLRNGVSGDEISHLTVYRADPATGQPLSGTVKTCSTNCYRFTWDPAARHWVQVAGTSWPANTQRACGDEARTDYLGVYVEGQYQWKTGLFNPIFGSSSTIAERTVMRLEPIGTQNQCQ